MTKQSFLINKVMCVVIKCYNWIVWTLFVILGFVVLGHGTYKLMYGYEKKSILNAIFYAASLHTHKFTILVLYYGM